MAHPTRPRRRHVREASLGAAVTLLAAAIARGQSNFDEIGLTQLLADYPGLSFDGTGVRVGQVEALTGSDFEVDPAAVGEPTNFFTYTDEQGSVSYTFSGSPTGHQDIVGGIFYGTAPGVVTNVSHVDEFEADYFNTTMIADGISIPDAVVNQSTNTDAPQQLSDTEFDNYIDAYGTIFVCGAGYNGSILAPSTAYNEISVGDGNPAISPTGPTIDNGRSKPDITAPGNDTSYSAPLVSGAATILVQAGTRGDGGSNPTVEAEAVDFRTVTALLLNGAVKNGYYGISAFTRTPVEPLDPLTGAGLLNIDNSYQQLIAGTHTASSVSTTTSVGGAHIPVTTGTTYCSLTGWDFSTLTTTANSDTYANYVFQPPAGTSAYSLTATLDWARQYNPNTATSIGINTLALYLYDTTSHTLLDWSNSAVDNVQDVCDNNLIAGDVYDLEVLKNGGAAVISDTETYALAFTNTANTSGSVNTCTWTANGGGDWGNAAYWYNGSIAEHGSETADFTNAIDSPATIMVGAPWFFGAMNFFNSNSYTIAPSNSNGTLCLNNGASTAHITDSGGNHYISTPIALLSALQVTVVNSADTLSISGTIADGTPGFDAPLQFNGSGTLLLCGTSTYSGGTTIDSGTLAITSDAALGIGPVAFGVNGNGFNQTAFGGGVLQLNNCTSSLSFTNTTGVCLGAVGSSTLCGVVTNYLFYSAALYYFGPGTLALNNANTYTGGTTILAGTLVIGTRNAIAADTAVTVGTGACPATLQLGPNAGCVALSSLQINNRATVDIANGTLAIDIASGGDPISTIVSCLSNGYNGGAWTGTSTTGGVITSSTAQAIGSNVSIGYGDGNVDAAETSAAPNQILVKYTLTGDANLDGVVNFTDFATVLKYFDQSGTDWSEGNFAYAANSPSIASTNFTDFADVLKNFLQPLPAGADQTPDGALQQLTTTLHDVSTLAVVPEPAGISLLAAGAAGMLGRRKRALSRNAARRFGVIHVRDFSESRHSPPDALHRHRIHWPPA